MLRLTLLLTAILFSLQVYSQTMYEKYNNYLNRYEYFDTYGQMIGYKTYNAYTKTWEYYKSGQTDNDMHLTETARYVGGVQAQLQARYEYNHKRLTNSIEALAFRVSNSSYSDYVKENSLKFFNEKCINGLNSQKYDLTSNSQITQIIAWLNSSMNNFIKFYVEQENKSKN
jgi:hypothetical protein